MIKTPFFLNLEKCKWSFLTFLFNKEALEIKLVAGTWDVIFFQNVTDEFAKVGRERIGNVMKKLPRFKNVYKNTSYLSFFMKKTRSLWCFKVNGVTGKSLSEAHIFASTNPHKTTDCSLFMKIVSSEYLQDMSEQFLVQNMFCRCCERLKKIYLYQI